MLSGRPVAAHPLNALDRLIRATATHQTITAMSCVTLILIVVLQSASIICSRLEIE